MNRSEASEDQDQFKTILSRMTREKMQDTVQPQTVLITLQSIMEFVQDIVEQLEKSELSLPSACCSGCSYCCHSQIKVIPAEALLIFAFIEKYFDPAQIKALKARIQSNRLLVKGKTFKQRVAIKDKTPCIFLINAACSIYAARPLICRSWHSFDRSACEAAFTSGNHNAEIKTFAARNYMFGIAREVFQDMGDQMDLENGIYIMPEAIWNCFIPSSPLENWLLGKQVFHPA
ncbi:MAG: YkgJ family cysteine cluster protein [Proteobacteria bacterium]|nr:YkgJ family cysteine cluster protein [Pseudomonadota bacterium]MBU1583164.1 YkgJ family cysteine cluster protein [Pseudomonadota bacterium]MBU2454072.1 YkgJ family cysteine cluster protein [Pseudomonadota bacterium]